LMLKCASAFQNYLDEVWANILFIDLFFFFFSSFD
jgi:hypothetical protein